jgi:hypothetical protein
MFSFFIAAYHSSSFPLNVFLPSHYVILILIVFLSALYTFAFLLHHKTLFSILWTMSSCFQYIWVSFYSVSIINMTAEIHFSALIHSILLIKIMYFILTVTVIIKVIFCFFAYPYSMNILVASLLLLKLASAFLTYSLYIFSVHELVLSSN